MRAEIKKVQPISNEEVRLLMCGTQKFLAEEEVEYETNHHLFRMQYSLSGYSVKSWAGLCFSSTR